jgi:hypothetical protein
MMLRQAEEGVLTMIRKDFEAMVKGTTDSVLAALGKTHWKFDEDAVQEQLRAPVEEVVRQGFTDLILAQVQAPEEGPVADKPTPKSPKYGPSQRRCEPSQLDASRGNMVN